MKNIRSNRYEDKNLGLLLFTLFNMGIVLFVIISALFNTIHPLLTLSSIIFIIVVTLPILSTKINWAHPLMIQMIILLMQAMSIMLRATGYIPLEYPKFRYGFITTDLELLYIKTIGINTLGLLCTYIFAFRFNFSFKKVVFNLRKTKFVYGLLIIAWGSFVIILYKIGSIGYILNNYQMRLTTFTSESIQYFVYLTQIGTVVGVYFYLIEKKKMSYFVLSIQVLISIILGDRGQIIFNIILPMIIVHHYYYKKISLKKLITLFIAVIVFYQSMGIYRSYGMITNNMDSMWERIISVFKNVEHFGITSNVIHLIDSNQVDYLLGKPLINILYAPFPRSIFSWKPTFIAESALVGSLIYNIDYYYIGLPPGLYGYGYLNFGLIGVVLFGIVSGIFVNQYYNKLIGSYIRSSMKIPNGNLLIYASYINLVVNPLSTEVQIKVLMTAVPLVGIYIFAKKQFAGVEE